MERGLKGGRPPGGGGRRGGAPWWNGFRCCCACSGDLAKPAEPERGRFAEPERGRFAEPDRGRFAEPERGKLAEPERGRFSEPDRGRFAEFDLPIARLVLEFGADTRPCGELSADRDSLRDDDASLCPVAWLSRDVGVGGEATVTGVGADVTRSRVGVRTSACVSSSTSSAPYRSTSERPPNEPRSIP